MSSKYILLSFSYNKYHVVSKSVFSDNEPIYIAMAMKFNKRRRKKRIHW